MERRRVFMLFTSMNDLVGPGWTAPQSSYSCVLDLEAVVRVWSSVRSSYPHDFLSKCTTMVMIGVRSCVLNRRNDFVYPGRTVGTFVPLCAWPCGVDAVWGHNLTLIPYHKISMAMAGVCLSWLRRWDDLGGPGRTECTFVFLCLNLKLLTSFNSQCGHNLTLIVYRNILQWRWSMCVYFGLTDGTTPLDLDKQNVRLYPCVWLWCCYSVSIQCEVIISHSFPVKIYCHGDDGCAFMLVEFVGRSYRCRTNSQYVCMSACLFLKV